AAVELATEAAVELAAEAAVKVAVEAAVEIAVKAVVVTVEVAVKAVVVTVEVAVEAVVVAVEAVVVAAVVPSKTLIPLVALHPVLVGESRRGQGVDLRRHSGAIPLPMSSGLEPKNQGRNRGSHTAGFHRQCALRHCFASHGMSGRPGL